MSMNKEPYSIADFTFEVLKNSIDFIKIEGLMS